LPEKIGKQTADFERFARKARTSAAIYSCQRTKIKRSLAGKGATAPFEPDPINTALRFDFILDRKNIRGALCKSGFEFVGLLLQRNRQPRTSLHEAAHVEVEAAFESQHRHLRGMHKSMEQSARRDFIVKYQHVDIRERRQVHEVREISAAHFLCLCVKRRRRYPRSAQRDGFHFIQQFSRKIPRYRSSQCGMQRLAVCSSGRPRSRVWPGLSQKTSCGTGRKLASNFRAVDSGESHFSGC
jgi:hypothetical protein